MRGVLAVGAFASTALALKSNQKQIPANVDEWPSQRTKTYESYTNGLYDYEEKVNACKQIFDAKREHFYQYTPHLDREAELKGLLAECPSAQHPAPLPASEEDQILNSDAPTATNFLSMRQVPVTVLGDGPEVSDGSMFGYFLRKQQDDAIEAEKPKIPDLLPAQGENSDEGPCGQSAKWEHELKAIEQKLAAIRPDLEAVGNSNF